MHATLCHKCALPATAVLCRLTICHSLRSLGLLNSAPGFLADSTTCSSGLDPHCEGNHGSLLRFRLQQVMPSAGGSEQVCRVQQTSSGRADPSGCRCLRAGGYAAR